MKELLISALLMISVFGYSQSPDTYILSYENKDYAAAITGLNEFVNSHNSQHPDYLKSKYYLGKSIFDMLQSDNSTDDNSYETALEHWKYIFKNDSGKKWLHLAEKDIVHLVRLSCTKSDKTVDYKKEIDIYKELLNYSADNPVLNLGLGDAHDHGNEHDVAFHYYTKIIQSYFEKKNSQYTSVTALACQQIAEDQFSRKNNYSQSLQYARLGLQYDAENVKLQTLEALSLFKSTDKEGGLKKFEIILSKNPDNKYVRDKYLILLENTKPEKAVTEYEMALKNNPDNTRALFFLGQHYTQKATDLYNSGGKPQEVQALMLKGIDYFEKYRKLKPDDKEVSRSLIKFYENLRMNEKAEEIKKELGD